LPKEYANSKITLKHLGGNLKIKLNGYGNKVVSASMNGKSCETKEGILFISENHIVVVLETSY
jgi:hypothetical protein